MTIDQVSWNRRGQFAEKPNRILVSCGTLSVLPFFLFTERRMANFDYLVPGGRQEHQETLQLLQFASQKKTKEPRVVYVHRGI